ncbi:MAG: GIY-YIG nuclease family protein [Patescibacteria group bacterium]
MLNVSNLPTSSGVYLFKNGEGNILYVGKALNVRVRVTSHFQKNVAAEKERLLGQYTKKVEVIPVTSELEALLLEAHLIKTNQPPFNTRAKDDKHPLYIKITRSDEYPRVFTVRREEEKGAVYFGPFPSSATVKQVLRFLRSIFPFDTQKTIGGQACFWAHIGLCNPCPSTIKKLPEKEGKLLKRVYRKNIQRLVAVLSRRTKWVKRSLLAEMREQSKKENFEEAAKIRDQIARLDYVTKEYRSVSSFLENPNLITDVYQNEVRNLTHFLASRVKYKKRLFTRIECYDASHTAMVYPTVGMVTFVNGEPEKKYYRKFRIYGKVIDDLSFLEEALRRRFAHKEWRVPDLVVIDGGKTQVGRARKVLKELRIRIPVVGLVKPLDNLVIPHKDGFQVLRVKDKLALSLLQRLRDEAHRFARAYHRTLRSRTLIPPKVSS